MVLADDDGATAMLGGRRLCCDDGTPFHITLFISHQKKQQRVIEKDTHDSVAFVFAFVSADSSNREK